MKATAAPQKRVELMALRAIQGATNNPKAHDVHRLRLSLREHGVGELPMLDERTGRLVAGHGRLDALKAMLANGEPAPAGVSVGSAGEWFVPVLRGWASKSDADASRYLVRSNALTTAGGWDEDALSSLLQSLPGQETLDELGFSSRKLVSFLATTKPTIEPLVAGEVCLACGQPLPREKPTGKKPKVVK